MALLKPAVAISILAAMLMFLAFVPGQAQAATDCRMAVARDSNPYVGEPTVSNTGRVTHDLTDMYGNSYNYNDEGGWGRAKVLGYHVKSDGPHGWVWRAGTSTTDQLRAGCESLHRTEGQALRAGEQGLRAKPWNGSYRQS